MSNFMIKFEVPWLLLLLIPAIVLTFLPYFKLAKRYRRTRNRIVSIVLHLAIMVMAVSLLAGMTFTYDIPNEENEVILVVDMSYSSVEDKQTVQNKFAQKDAFVRDVINESNDIFKVGIVAFGYNSVTVAEPSLDTQDVLEKYFAFRDEEDYLEAQGEKTQIDNTASDISSALEYAASLITSKTTSKLVLISDGVQTDGDAVTMVKRLAAEGIKIDAAVFDRVVEPDFEITNVTIPEANYSVGDTAQVTVSINSSILGDAKITVYDEDEADDNFEYEAAEFDIDLDEGLNEYRVSCTFSKTGMHRIRFNVIGSDDNTDVNEASVTDAISENNVYYSYLYLNVYEDILILEGFEGEADAIYDLLSPYYNGGDTIKVVNISQYGGDYASVPKTVDELRMYDQIILANVANADLIGASMPKEVRVVGDKTTTLTFDMMLEEYVNLYGGGLFMFGGNEEATDDDGNPVAHSFNRSDMGLRNAKTLSGMLPVEVVDYTPPVAVMMIVDRSGSMAETLSNGGKTKLDYAKDAAMTCLDSLTYRDYMGMMSFENTYTVSTNVTSIQNRSLIETAILQLSAGGGTQFANALQRAGEALSALGDDVVSKRHVVIITDGESQDPAVNEDESDSGNLGWAEIMKAFNEQSNITFSIMHLKNGEANENYRMYFEVWGGGSYIQVDASNLSTIGTTVRNELKANVIQEFNPSEEYSPTVVDYSSNIFRGVSTSDLDSLPVLTGYYGTRIKDGADVILKAPYVPLYAQWNYGKGKVGTFLASLKGDNLSSAFINSGSGSTILRNIVTRLMPSTDIKPKDINVSLTEENYTTKLSVSTSMQEGQRLRVSVTPLNDPSAEPQEVEFSAADGYSRASVTITQPGVHKLVVTKYTYDDETELETIISTTTVYRAFSYSKEYDVFVDDEQVDAFVTNLTTSGRGSVIDADEAQRVYSNFETGIHKTYDPRMLFMILSIVLFLLDVAVRKFKFKWPHEIIRDYKERKKLEN